MSAEQEPGVDYPIAFTVPNAQQLLRNMVAMRDQIERSTWMPFAPFVPDVPQSVFRAHARKATKEAMFLSIYGAPHEKVMARLQDAC